MAHTDDLERRDFERAEAEKRNPLLKLDLGELVREMQRIAHQDSNVLLDEAQIPKESMILYNQYSAIVRELNGREREYKAYKHPPVF